MGHWAANKILFTRLVTYNATLYWGVCSMKKIIGVLLVLLAGSWFVSCGTTDTGIPLTVRGANSGVVEGCEKSEGVAVSIMAEDSQNHLPLDGLRIRYRIAGGEWNPEVVVNELPYLISGPAGEYEIEVRKEGFPLRTATILVPQEPSCGIIKQDWILYADRPSCPTIPPVIEIQVVANPPHEGGLEILLTPAQGFKDRIPCDNLDSCHFNIEFSQVGDYVVEFLGFQDHKELVIVDDRVHYSYTDVTITMNDGGSHHKTIISEGVNKIVITIPYDYGDSGCHEVVFSEMEIVENHVSHVEQNNFQTLEKEAFTIGTVPSASCPEGSMNRANFEVEYNVLLPAGTRISEVEIEYYSEQGWAEARCTENDGYTCHAVYPNPFYGDKYEVRALIEDKVLTGSSISLENKCIIFN